MRRQAGSVWRLAGAALILAALAGCRSADSARKPPDLRIGVRENAAPLVFRERNRWQGLEADLARLLAGRLEMRPVFVALPGDQLPAALLAGKVDVLMAGLPVREELRTEMDFATPYLVVGQAALVRTGDLRRFNTAIKIRSVQGPVAVRPDTDGARFVARYFSRAESIAFDRTPAAVQALLDGQVMLVFDDAPALWWTALQYSGQVAVAPALFDRREIAWAFRRGSVSLREAANAALADWQRDGTLENVLRRWIPFSK